jgi:transposase-like protein
MARPSKYPLELRERAVRLVLQSRGDYSSEYEAIRWIAGKLGLSRWSRCAVRFDVRRQASAIAEGSRQ